jgi:putative acetyltransferase
MPCAGHPRLLVGSAKEDVDGRDKPGHDERMATPSITLRPYSAADEDAAIELWRRTWQKHYPHLNFTERVPWWRERWRKELVPVARVVVAELDGALIGFVTVDPTNLYLDQIVVAPEHWGSGVALMLLDEAKRISPRGLDLLVNKDNFRAIRFYEKHGFVYAGEDKNPVSGKPVNRMTWRPARAL